MPLTLIPMLLNFMTGFAVWYYDIGITPKVILTIVLVLKFSCYFYSVLISDTEWIRKAGCIICVLLNVGIIITAALLSAWIILINSAITLGILLLWSCAAVFDFSKKGGN